MYAIAILIIFFSTYRHTDIGDEQEYSAKTMNKRPAATHSC